MRAVPVLPPRYTAPPARDLARGPALRVAVIGLAVALFVPGCKRRPHYDLHTPKATLASFEEALNNGHIPRDLRKFVNNPHELELWRLRCQTHGCAKGKFEVDETGPVADDRVVLYADYEVTGADHATLLEGHHAPIYFELAGDRWLIRQFGDHLRPTSELPSHQPTAPGDGGPAAPPGDAGTPPATPPTAPPAARGTPK